MKTRKNSFKQLVSGHLISRHLTLQQVHGLGDAAREIHQRVGRVPPVQTLVAAIHPGRKRKTSWLSTVGRRSSITTSTHSPKRQKRKWKIPAYDSGFSVSHSCSFQSGMTWKGGTGRKGMEEEEQRAVHVKVCVEEEEEEEEEEPEEGEGGGGGGGKR
ncbi:hypothetical protein EYF80_027815 [Liparis tanakae]|uniref:Uncharacterized protein n=1 Tax=Liparis tanakae TaxID=230148 RepID=A0A4Z2H8Y2_9TELE|nr:hypothetical protein EYF80_027815 [Liparis tanakae]